MKLLNKCFWYIRTFIYRLFGMQIGKRCLIGKPLFILGFKNIIIKDNVRIFPLSRFEVHNNGEIILNQGVSIGQCFHIISSGNSLKIGKNTLISANVFISNCEHLQGSTKLIEKETIISDNCFIGYGAVILPGTKIGNNCVIGANAVVKGTFPDNSVIAGVPAKVIKKTN
ncbi:lipopolysaccharide biosynthesis protein [Photobacterium phosphoreum]|uniref:acyltransferase n=1 Tax=Photobacterium phosphoreum TaxID=659 RepID=UPI000D164B29|nr:acyltransferase [Photobacterium phosphoreum]PSU68069.1 lipopolysaccharide biosynthesis protein [Photobacterium phosphoreum]